MRFLPKELGQSIVEVLIALGLAAIMLPALATAVAASREGRVQDSDRLQAAGLLREAEEAVRSVRETSWNQFSVNGTFHPVISGNVWSLAPGAETVGIFSRQIVVSDARRNSSGALVMIGGTIDPSTKQVAVSVSWSSPIASTLTSESYWQRYQGNTAWTQSAMSDFSAGTTTSTSVTNNSGGEVELSPAVINVDWSSPGIIGSYNASGTQDALDVAVEDPYAYISDGTILTILDISDPSAPVFVGSYSAPGTVYHIFISGNYAYLSTNSNTAELVVVDITDPAAPVLAGSENLAGTADARTTSVDGNYAYVGRISSTTTGSNEFQILNISNPANPAPTGGLNISGNVYNIKVNNNYAYLGTTLNTQELYIANVTNKNAPTAAGSYNAAGTSDTNDLALVGTTLYLGLTANTSGAEVFALDISNPTVPALLDTYESGVTVNGLSSLDDYLFLATATAGSQLIVVNAAVPGNLFLETNINLGSTAYDVKANSYYAFVATASNTQEMMVIGPGLVWGYETSGTYESSTFDAGSSVGFNYLTFVITEPASTNIQFQIASNNDSSTWNYVGPDGSAGTYYMAPAAVPLSNASGRYFRFRAEFSGPSTSTPVLADISLNYSP